MGCSQTKAVTISTAQSELDLWLLYFHEVETRSANQFNTEQKIRLMSRSAWLAYKECHPSFVQEMMIQYLTFLYLQTMTPVQRIAKPTHPVWLTARVSKIDSR